MIHILLPTRGHPERLKTCIKSFADGASSVDNFKIILRIDRDDLDTINSLLEIAEFKNVSWIIGDEIRTEYRDLFRHYQELCDAIPTNDFVWFMEDEGILNGKGWDEQILAHMPIEGMIGYPQYAGEFPIVPNKCWEQFGHKELGRDVDRWLYRTLIDWKTHTFTGFTVNYQPRKQFT